jgi:hypothetical protein
MLKVLVTRVHALCLSPAKAFVPFFGKWGWYQVPPDELAVYALEDSLDVVAARGYLNSEEILAAEEAGITVTCQSR